MNKRDRSYVIGTLEFGRKRSCYLFAKATFSLMQIS